MRGSMSISLGRRSVLRAALVPALAGPFSVQAGNRPPVVATFSILHDLAVQVAGPEARVVALVGANGDTHDYQATPVDAQAIARAGLLVSNGLGFETWLPRLLRAARFTGRHVVASEGVVPMLRASSSGGGSNVPDPHCWHDVANARHYVANIAAGLAIVEPANAAHFREQARLADERLAVLDTWVRAQIARVAPDKRRVITSHDAFAYLGRAYGVQFIALQGMDHHREPTPREMAAIIRRARDSGTKAFFFEHLGNPRLTEQIARDAGAVVGPALYADALSPPDGPASTYEALMRHNVAALVAGMSSN
ncbi:MAG: zinc ABC transporter substrate-binding protein [Enhydrobacter sp.]|nr:zinc ABC transporter substrate-binding protein [Enhydrobacter sp.]